MAYAHSSDRHLEDGSWQTISDILADCPDNTGIDDYLLTISWAPFMHFGARETGMWIETWESSTKPGYLLAVSNGDHFSSFMLVDSFPELMDLFAKWAPVVQASALTGLIEDLKGQSFLEGGMVEMVAARVLYGAQQELPRLEREAGERRARYFRQRQAKGTP